VSYFSIQFVVWYATEIHIQFPSHSHIPPSHFSLFQKLTALLPSVHRDRAVVLLPRRLLELGVDLSALRVRAKRAAEEEDVRLRTVDRIVLPPPGLLHADSPPLRLRQKTGLRESLADLLGEDHVPVLALVVLRKRGG